MPLLTKKFTRDSLKRASGVGVGITNDSKDVSMAEIIREEKSHIRSKSMQNRNALNERQRRQRSFSGGPSSPYRSFGSDNHKSQVDPAGPKLRNTVHPNDVFNQAYNEAELLTQMSSLTEPTWTPSVVGGSDINSVNNGQTRQNQRNRTTCYSNLRHQTCLERNNTRIRPKRATITISTAKDHKETKILLLDNIENETRKVGPIKSDINYGHHERANHGIERNEVHRIEREEVRDDVKNGKILLTSTPSYPHNTTEIDQRDDVPNDDLCRQSSKEKHTSSRHRSKARREDDASHVLRIRGRSGRPTTDRKSKKRSSSLSSQRSSQTTKTASKAPTISEFVSTSSSYSTSVASTNRRAKKSSIVVGRQTTGIKQKGSTTTRSSSVPPSTANSKRNQRTLSMPPLDSKKEEKQRLCDESTNKSRGKKNVVSNRINRCSGADVTEQKIKTNSESNSNGTMNTVLNTVSIAADIKSCSSQSKYQSTVSSNSPIPGMSLVECSSTPLSAVQAARISLRPRLRRSNSNRSISSANPESMISSVENEKGSSSGNTDRKPKSVVAPTLATKTKYPSRTHKLVQDAHVKKIHEQRVQRRTELERKRQKKGGEKHYRKAAIVAQSTIEADGEEPHHTTTTTLVFDFLLFNFLLLLALPQRIIFYLWSLTFSKTWTARRKNVLVTGANSAIGSEIAKQFAIEGANLILISHSTSSSKSNLNRLVEECHELGSGKILFYSANLSNAISARLALEQAAKDFNDTLDVVILNGDNKSHGCLFEEILDVHQIEKMVKENVIACIVTLHYLLKLIPKTSDSRIVILSSTSGMVASPYRSVCGATQHALKGFCDSIRMELASTYSNRRAPKVCFASFPELVGQNIHNRDDLDSPISQMGAERAPMKTRSWARIPLQQAVHGLLDAIKKGERDFGSPQYLVIWRLVQVLAPGLVDFSVFRHFRKTQYRPGEDVMNTSEIRKGGNTSGTSRSNKTWV
mmetsp:Transcript_3912/g.10237  ORF Transcript_3912/g.10237 Transcript_3912/m.10237 type:complete len:978 (-) Transcript_3912:80-3013(-)